MTRISAIKERIPIGDLLEHYGAQDVPQSISGWKGMVCPFCGHQSGSVNHVVDRFHCHHGCGVGGDVLDVVQDVEGLASVREAMDWIEANVVG